MLVAYTDLELLLSLRVLLRPLCIVLPVEQVPSIKMLASTDVVKQGGVGSGVVKGKRACYALDDFRRLDHPLDLRDHQRTDVH